MMKLIAHTSLRRAKALSILKWKFIHDRGLNYIRFTQTKGEFIELHSLQDALSGGELCGLCEKYIMEDYGGGCEKCPLHDRHKNCCKEYEKWFLSKQPRWLKYWSGKLLERLMNLKRGSG